MNEYDLIIIGAGPSALTAAIYACREGIKTLVLEKTLIGGLMATVDKIDNYPGYESGIEGFILGQNFEKQARRFGAEIKLTEVESIRKDGNKITVNTDTDDYQAKACLIATGATYRQLDLRGERKYYAKGVHYCATCDGAFYNGKHIAVIGGANSAVQETMYLTKFASHIDLIVRSHLKASQTLQQELQQYIDDNKVTLYQGYTPREITGDGQTVNGLDIVKSDDSSSEKHLDEDGVFIFAGTTPNTAFLADSGVVIDDGGCVVVDDTMQTNVAGIFASGDVRSGAMKQIITAAGDGAEAALSIRKYLGESK